MSLKTVELQVAIHRTNDIGQLQSQLLQKPVQDQEMLAAAQLKQLELERKRSNKPEETSKHVKADKDGKQQNAYTRKMNKAKRNIDDSHVPEHPYKGHQIDITL